MKLDVLPNPPDNKSWYADGLQFTCTQCGNCCTGGPGYVWLSDTEVTRLAEFLTLSREQTLEKYCRNVFGRISLNENRNARGEYDCVFLVEQKSTAPVAPADSGVVTQPKRGCSIYPVRPLQCRTWPFWEGNLMSEESWDRASVRCHGMDRGRAYTLAQIERLRDALDWPENPPTSAPKSGATTPVLE